MTNDSFDCLDRNLNVFGMFFLEASAGTGKTFAIEQIVTRLILENRAIDLSNILVVTFTRAATRELKLRIRQNIEFALHVLKSPTTDHGFDYLLPILEKTDTEKNELIWRLEEALHTFNQAKIFTLHGFCHAMLTKYAFEAHFSFDAQEENLYSYKNMMQQSLRRFLTILPAGEISPTQLYLLLKAFARNMQSLIEKIYFIVHAQAAYPDLMQFSSALEIINEKLADFPQVSEERLFDDLVKIGCCYKTLAKNQEITPDYLRQIKLWVQVLKNRAISYEEFDQLLLLQPFFSFICEDHLYKQCKYPENVNNSHIIDHLRRHLLPIIERLRNPQYILLKIAQAAGSYIETSLQHADVLSPDGILDAMVDNLSNPAFSQAISKEFSAVIVDEFQDTDSKQWDIFSRLFLHKNHIQAFYLVGDPKQSIYSFRGADLHTYSLALKQMGKQYHTYLDKNFRSEPPLVEALNHLFANEHWLTMQNTREKIRYHPVSAGLSKQTNFSDGKGALHFFWAQSQAKANSSLPDKELEQKMLFPFITQEIQNLCLRKEATLNDFAILVKDRYSAGRIEEFLHRARIPCVTHAVHSLAETTALDFLEKLFLALAFPHNMSRVKQFFLHPFMDISIDNLEEEQEDEKAFATALAHIHELHHILIENGQAAMFTRLFSLRFFEKNLLENILGQGAQEYQDLIQCLERLMEKEIPNQTKPLAILERVKSFRRKTLEEDPKLQKRNAHGKNAVTIMSMHASKGLEFPIVFALGVAYRTPPVDDLILSRKDRIWKLFQSSREECQTFLAERDEEKMRNLYVAFTRAKKRLYILLCTKAKNTVPELGSAAPIELFLARSLFPDTYGDDLYRQIPSLDMTIVQEYLDRQAHQPSITFSILEEEIDPIAASLANQREEALIKPPLLTFAHRKKMISSFSRLSAKKPRETASQEITEGSALPVRGSAVGILLHEIFEKILQKGLANPYQEKAIKKIIGDTIRYSTLEPFRPEVTQLVQMSLQTPLLPLPCAICDIPPDQMIPEAQFIYPTAIEETREIYMKGVMDLCFSYAGKLYLLDWKSNDLGPDDASYDKNALEKAMDENDYFLQAKIYREALTKYLHLTKQEFGGVFYLFIRGITNPTTHGLCYLPG